MIRFLFWNINGKPLEGLVSRIVTDHRADVVALVECELDAATLLLELNRDAPAFHYPASLCRRIKVFTRFGREFLTPRDEGDRWSIRRLALPARREILLTVAHLPSKAYRGEDEQVHACHLLAERISQQEHVEGHRRTVLVGDLNSNPFEKGVVGVPGLHAVMSKDVAARVHRTVDGKEYTFFYNPMWARFGDRSEGPPGTYYYDKGRPITYFWNILDQVLVRPALVDGFRHEDLKILTEAGGTSLIGRNGQPDRVNASDHLPVGFAIDF